MYNVCERRIYLHSLWNGQEIYWCRFFFQLVDEFLSGQRITMAPQTFHMGGLLQEMREIEESEFKYTPERGIDWLEDIIKKYRWILNCCSAL